MSRKANINRINNKVAVCPFKEVSGGLVLRIGIPPKKRGILLSKSPHNGSHFIMDALNLKGLGLEARLACFFHPT